MDIARTVSMVLSIVNLVHALISQKCPARHFAKRRVRPTTNVKDIHMSIQMWGVPNVFSTQLHPVQLNVEK